MTFPSLSQGEKKLQTVSQQERTGESPTDEQREMGFLNYRYIEKRNVQIARTILARDYKGFGSSSETSNGVIEWKRKRK